MSSQPQGGGVPAASGSHLESRPSDAQATTQYKWGDLLKKLLEDPRNIDFADLLLLSYSCYGVTSLELLKTILDEYRARAADLANVKDKDAKKRIKSHLAGCAGLVKRWIKLDGNLLEDGELLVTLQQSQEDPNPPPLKDALKDAVKKSAERHNLIEKCVRSAEVERSKARGTLVLNSMRMDELAQQMTLADLTVYQWISSMDILRHVRRVQLEGILDDIDSNAHPGGSTAEQKSLIRMRICVNRFKKIVRWLVHEILNVPDPEGRAELIGKVIALGTKLKSQNNYNGVMQVVCCLHSDPILRLQMSWNLVPQQRLEKLSKLTEIMSPKNNFEMYRMQIMEDKPPFVPYLGTIVMDVIFVERFHDSFTMQTTKCVNLRKAKQLHSKLSVLQRATEGSTSVQARKQIQEFFFYGLPDVRMRDLLTLSEQLESPDVIQYRRVASFFRKPILTGAENMVEGAALELWDKDWEFLMSGSQIETFAPGELIITEGVWHPKIYRIQKGYATIEKRGSAEANVVVGKGHIFGELSMLDNMHSTFSVRAFGDHTVVVNSLDGRELVKLFRTESNLAHRFFASIATRLVEQLRKLLDMTFPSSAEPNPIHPVVAVDQRRSSHSAVLSINRQSSDDSVSSLSSKMDRRRSEDVEAPLRRKSFRSSSSSADGSPRKRVNKNLELPQLDMDSGGSSPGGARMRGSRGSQGSRGSHGSRASRPHSDYTSSSSRRTSSLGGELSGEETITMLEIESEQGGKNGWVNDDTLSFNRIGNLEFCKRFSLPRSEHMMKEYPCTKEKNRGIDQDGVMYISKNYICHYSKMFNIEAKEMIVVQSVTAIQMKGANRFMLKWNNRSATFRFKDNSEMCLEAHDFISNLRNCATTMEELNETAAPTVPLTCISKSQKPTLHSQLTLSRNFDPNKWMVSEQDEEISTSFNLRKSDWELMLQVGTSRNYSPGEVVVKENNKEQKIIYIVSGNCRMEKDTINESSGVALLGTLSSGDVAGEETFIDQQGNLFSVIAETSVMVLEIPGYVVNLLVTMHMDLGHRFYCYLSSVSADRFRKALRREDEMERVIPDILGTPFYLSLPPITLMKTDASRVEVMSVCGPEDLEHGDVEEFLEETSFCSARSITTYPFNPEKPDVHVGAPICDFYNAKFYERSAIIAVADGCSWGPAPQAAAMNASRAFVDFLSKYQNRMHDVQSAGKLVMRAFAIAHDAITRHDSNNVNSWEIGTTTLCGGVVIPMEDEEEPPRGDLWECGEHPPESGTIPNLSDAEEKPMKGRKGKGSARNSNISDPLPRKKWAFVFGNVGDCKAFHYSPITKQLSDITPEARISNDAKDCGGRLGPYLEGNLPDLRNFRLRFVPCNPGDILFICTDGVHDNIDPEHLGIPPRDFGFDFDKWDQVPWEEAEKVKLVWRLEALHKLFFRPEDAASLYKGGVHRRRPSSLQKKGKSGAEGEEGERVDQGESRSVRFAGTKTLKEMRKMTPTKITDTLLEFCENTNANAIEWMQTNPSQKLPVDYVNYPGKMDHCTCLSFSLPVDSFGFAKDESEGESLHS